MPEFVKFSQGSNFSMSQSHPKQSMNIFETFNFTITAATLAQANNHSRPKIKVLCRLNPWRSWGIFFALIYYSFLETFKLFYNLKNGDIGHCQADSCGSDEMTPRISLI